MLLHIFHPHRLKSAEPDMKRNLRGFNSTLRHAGEHFWSEVQSCGRRCRGPTFLGVDSLVTLPIFRTIFAIDVGRQRHMPNSLNDRKEVGHRSKPDSPLPETATRHHVGFQFVLLPEEQALTDSDFSSRTDQALPLVWLIRDLPGEQHLNAPPQKIPRCRILGADRLCLDADSSPIQSRWKHTCIVKYQKIVGPQQVGEILKCAVFKPPGRAIEMKHS